MTKKEQTTQRKITIKSLDDKVNELSKRLITSENKSNFLEQKVKELSRRLEEKQSEKDPIEDERQDLNCFKCPKSFKTRKLLRTHIKETHSKLYNCEDCESTFDEKCKLERHLKSHEKIKDKKCNLCEKTFYLEWRLKKHKSIHENKSLKKCHYFNNDKLCPFEDIGCMFLHVQSSRCFFSGICTRKLCPYSHIPNRTDNDESSNKSDAVTEESESENVTREVNLFNDVLNSYHEEEADKTVDMDELCDNILQNTSIVFNNGEEDILSDSFIDNLIMHKERQLLKLNTDDSDEEEDFKCGTF